MSKKLSLKGSEASWNKKKFPETITHKIFETNSQKHRKVSKYYETDCRLCLTEKFFIINSVGDNQVLNKTFEFFIYVDNKISI